MYCRDWAIWALKRILDLIHEGKEDAIEVKELTDKILLHYDYEQFNLSEEEIPKDRLLELIKFCKISTICEYDLCETPEDLYEVFRKHLPADVYEKIEENRKAGNLIGDVEL